MLTNLLLPALLLLKGIDASPVELDERQEAPCQDVQVFIARGSIEPYPGRQGALADAICAGNPSCGYQNIVYPATFENYCSSVQAGVVSGTALITAYAARCPFSRLVLTGYSQGAQVVGDMLGGGGGKFNDCTQTTSFGLNPMTSPGNQIAAATLFGDVRHTANQVYNTGTGSSRNGIYPRAGGQLASLNRYSFQLRSWCLAGDPVCAGGTDPNAHTSYFNVFTDEAAAWVQSHL